MTDESARSAEACPECGAHRLALLDLPLTPAAGYQVYAEIVGVADLQPESRPSIGCLACGAEWPDLEAFREASRTDPR
jgi:hypothetical protein